MIKMKLKKIVTIGFLFCLMCAMTGCKGNVSDVTIYMNGGTPEAKFKSYLTSDQIITDGSANINYFYDSYVFDNKTYYRSKNCDEYDFENQNVKFMDGEVLKISLKELTKRNKKPNILDHKIIVKMNGPVIETNGVIGEDNSTVIFNNPENLDEVYAYTEIGKEELNKAPVLSIKNKKKYYTSDNRPEFEIEGKYVNNKSKKLKFYFNNNKEGVSSKAIYLADFKLGLNKIYVVNEYGVKSNVVEFNYDKVECSVNKYRDKLIIKTYSGLKSLKTNGGKTKINIKKLKHKGNKYYVPINLIKRNVIVTTKSGIKDKYMVTKRVAN